MTEIDAVSISRVSADAVACAMDEAKRQMPNASEARRLLMILGNAAIACGRLRIERDDVLALVSGAYDQGASLPPTTKVFDE